MRKKTVVLMVVAVAVLVVATAALTAVFVRPKGDPVVRLNLAHFFPASHPWRRGWCSRSRRLRSHRRESTNHQLPGNQPIRRIYSGVVTGVRISASLVSYRGVSRAESLMPGYL